MWAQGYPRAFSCTPVHGGSGLDDSARQSHLAKEWLEELDIPETIRPFVVFPCDAGRDVVIVVHYLLMNCRTDRQHIASSIHKIPLQRGMGVEVLL
jgi:hypothetical protein